MDEQQDIMMRMLELTGQGYACSQILLMLAMELSGERQRCGARHGSVK